MILELARSTAAMAAIFLSGGIVYFTVIRKEDHRWLDAVSYGWGAGIVLLYMSGGLLIRLPWLFFAWHIYYLALLVLLTGGWALLHGRRHGLPRFRPPHIALSAPRIDLWVALMALFLVSHAMLLFWIVLHRPVFDSDAIIPSRWVGLAKTIYRLGGLPPSTHAWNPTFPSLVPLWPNMFTARWHDSFAAFPWFCFYMLILLTSLQFIHRITGNLRAGLAYVCVLASIPLMWVHAIHPGFSDLIVCYFMAAVLSLLYYSHHYRQMRYFLFSLIFMAGACLSKQEAVGWMLLVYAGYGLLYWHVRHQKSAAKILGIEGVLIAIGFASYLLTADYFHKLVTGRFMYLGVLFRGRFDPTAAWILLERTLTWATFGMYWYFVLGILVFLVVQSRDAFARFLSAQSALVFGLILYYLCGTGNVKFTIAGTNASRLLLQWVPLGSVLYAVLVSQLLQARADLRSTKPRPHFK